MCGVFQSNNTFGTQMLSFEIPDSDLKMTTPPARHQSQGTHHMHEHELDRSLSVQQAAILR
jgi:hypothetical protein